jgi:hypothetical protein
MPTTKEFIRARTSRKAFARIMEDVPRTKGILAEIVSRNPGGLSRVELLALTRKRMPFRLKILDLFGFAMFTKMPFAIALEDLTEEGRAREEAEMFYPR